MGVDDLVGKEEDPDNKSRKYKKYIPFLGIVLFDEARHISVTLVVNGREVKKSRAKDGEISTSIAYTITGKDFE